MYVIMLDGKTVSLAINSQSLTGDKSRASTAVATLPFKKGFANMVQAFFIAQDMFEPQSREIGESGLQAEKKTFVCVPNRRAVFLK